MHTQLPVDVLKPDVLRELECARPLVVTAPTGSGKSTRLPIWLAERFGARVLVVEPRRIACRSLATFLSSQLGAPVGTDIGYRVRFDDCSQADTRILFVTPGVALRMLHDCADIPFSAIMLDEFHERGWETDLLLAALREHLSRGCRLPLVITSATIEASSLATTLEAVALEASGRQFPVHISHCDDVPLPSPDRLEERVATAVRNVLRDARDEGDILVFLPGMREIDACRSALRGDAARHNCEMIRVHGSLPTDKIARALSATSAQRRIFLATNVAETSLTLPNVTVVIDSGLARTRMHRAGRSSLVLTSVARSSMDQRAGRAGRVAPGRCVRLWASRFQPQDTTPPEVLRIELDDVLLNAAAMGVPLHSQGTSHWVTPPPEFAVSSAVERLRMLGALDDHGAISPFGRRLLALPVSVHEARLLVDVPMRLLGTLCDLVARLQTRGPFFLPDTGSAQRKRDEREAERARLLEGCGDEVMADLRCIRGGVPGAHGLHRTALDNARRLSSSLRGLLKASETDPVRDRTSLPPPSELASFLLTRWPEAGFVLRRRAQGKGHRKGGRGRGRPWGNGEVELLVTPHPLWKQDAESREGPIAGLILDHEW
ncbi:MAG: ATP-dependent RNA helicase, partial [Lentisphaeria bacterium]|nr:ATP-dependent RNA helicase [Lentisphaeria bacterium]